MYNQNYYFPRSNFTFRNGPSMIPPPPPPPAYFIPPPCDTGNSDEFVKSFEKNLTVQKCKPNIQLSIKEAKEKLHNLVNTLNNLKNNASTLTLNKTNLSDDEWKTTMDDIEKEKLKITTLMSQINDNYLAMLQKLIAKRVTKRMRLKRVSFERKKQKEEMRREREERSRKIDENLQKIKDDINRIKQEEESKLQADIVLKEVLRKKHDAKKCMMKLDAVVKLRKARENTARGRGETVSEREAAVFNNNIEKLKTLWVKKLAVYDTEEAELRAKLKSETEEPETDARKKEMAIADILNGWREFLFGDESCTPQRDFHGDVNSFVAVRSRWDQYISKEGTALPIGWVTPKLT